MRPGRQICQAWYGHIGCSCPIEVQRHGVFIILVPIPLPVSYLAFLASPSRCNSFFGLAAARRRSSQRCVLMLWKVLLIRLGAIEACALEV